MRSMNTALKAYALVCILVSPLALAESGDSGADPDSSTPRKVLGTDLHSIISSVSQKTHKTFLIDPRVRANVDLVGTDARDVTYPLLMTILEVYGFVAYEQNGVIVVVPDAYERHIPGLPVSASDTRPTDSEVITTIVVVKNASANQLVPILRPLMPQAAHLAAIGDRNALVLVDRAANTRRMVAIIEALDKLPRVKPPESKSD